MKQRWLKLLHIIVVFLQLSSSQGILDPSCWLLFAHEVEFESLSDYLIDVPYQLHHAKGAGCGVVLPQKLFDAIDRSSLSKYVPVKTIDEFVTATGGQVDLALVHPTTAEHEIGQACSLDQRFSVAGEADDDSTETQRTLQLYRAGRTWPFTHMVCSRVITLSHTESPAQYFATIKQVLGDHRDVLVDVRFEGNPPAQYSIELGLKGKGVDFNEEVKNAAQKFRNENLGEEYCAVYWYETNHDPASTVVQINAWLENVQKPDPGLRNTPLLLLLDTAHQDSEEIANMVSKINSRTVILPMQANRIKWEAQAAILASKAARFLFPQASSLGARSSALRKFKEKKLNDNFKQDLLWTDNEYQDIMSDEPWPKPEPISPQLKQKLTEQGIL